LATEANVATEEAQSRPAAPHAPVNFLA